MSGRIALFGNRESLRIWLADLLRNSGFDVDLYGPDAVPSLFDACLEAYTLVIAGTDVAAQLEEETAINASLVAQGFLVFNDRSTAWEHEPAFLLHAGMGPENIVTKINSIVYLNSKLRKSQRLRLQLPVEYAYGGNLYYSTMQDFSENGAFIITLLPPPVKAVLTVRFSLPGGCDIIAKGRAIYSINCNLEQNIIAHPSSSEKKIIALPGIGILFEQIADPDRAAIREFIKKSSW